MGPKQVRTLKAIFEEPVRSNIAWRDIEAMLESAGAEITEGAGSRVRIVLNGVRAVFYRPHLKGNRYLEFCKARGETPDKMFSGQLVARIPPDLHRQVNVAALLSGKSLNVIDDSLHSMMQLSLIAT